MAVSISCSCQLFINGTFQSSSSFCDFWYSDVWWICFV